MSYAIIRNKNYKIGQLPYLYRHNERKNIDYKNKNIKRENSYKNYSLKKPIASYQKTFEILKKEYNLKGQIKKVSNVLCELVVTSDKEFFEKIGENETRRYFETAYKFIANYQNLGEEFIVSAKVHLDETTPHMHIMYIPVIDTKDKKGRPIKKIACSEFWKGQSAYRVLQEKFYNYITDNGFQLERGKSSKVKHLSVEEFKKVTEYDKIKFELENEPIQQLDNSNMQMIVSQNQSLQLYNKKLKGYLTKSLKAIEKSIILEEQNRNLNEENSKLCKENNFLKKYIDKAYEYISILVNIPKLSIKNMIDKFFEELNERN